jgi:acyl-CoA reductase-like NAD-dependent aldehyde dehydrogenase
MHPPETASAPRLRTEPYQLLIDGAFVDAGDGATSDVISPRDGSVIARLAESGAVDVDGALAAARRAADGPWRFSSPRERAALLLRLGELIEAAGDELAGIEALDSGKPVGHVRTNDLPIALESIEFFAAQARTAQAPAYALADADGIHHPLVDPIGVVAELLPWNGPIWTGVQRLAAIVATGSTVVLKPSELGALPIARLAELTVEAGFPAGVVNVVYGGPQTGEALVVDPRVDLVSLTGGTRTGARVMELAARSIKQLSLELGGKNPFIVLADADVDQAAFWARLGGFANAGQICISASRFLVAREVYDEFVEKFAAQAAEVNVGDPLDGGSDVGTVITSTAADRVWDYVERTKQVGRLVAGGERFGGDDARAHGAFVPPTIFADVPATADAMRDEIFGPLGVVTPIDGLQHAVELANDSVYGLSAGVFTRDLDAAWTLSRALRAGEVYVNRWFSPGVLEAPVEGYNRSGVGRGGPQKYQRVKHVFFHNDIAAALPSR